MVLSKKKSLEKKSLVSKKVTFVVFVRQYLRHCIIYYFYAVRLFLSNFECYWLSLTNERIQLSLQDVVVGIISSQNSSLVSLLNFFYYYRKIVFMGLQKRSHAS